MQLDYTLLLDNIKRRRFDEAIRDHILSPSFSDESIPEPVRFAMESMQEVDQAYTYKVYANTRKIEKEILKNVNFPGVRIDVRYQGPLRTETHIRLYGEVDLMFILPNGSSSKDVFTLGQQIKEIASGMEFQSVDYSSGLHIKIKTQKPACPINILPASWIDNPQYLEKKNEIYRGVATYDFKAKTKKKNLPFLNMGRITMKDQDTKGGFKKAIRLLKVLSSYESVNLSTYELSSLLYKIDDEVFDTKEGLELTMLPHINSYIKDLVGDKEGFEVLLSPSEKELVFGTREDRKEAVAKLQSGLDKLVSDLKESLGGDLSTPVSYSTESSDESDSE